MGLSGYGGFGFYKYAAPTELKTDMPFVTFQKLFDLLSMVHPMAIDVFLKRVVSH